MLSEGTCSAGPAVLYLQERTSAFAYFHGVTSRREAGKYDPVLTFCEGLYITLQSMLGCGTGNGICSAVCRAVMSVCFPLCLLYSLE